MPTQLEPQDYTRNPADREGVLVSKEQAHQIGSSMMDAAARVAKGEPIPDFNPTVTEDVGTPDVPGRGPSGLIDSVPNEQEAMDLQLPTAPPIEEHEKWVPPARSSDITPNR